MIVAAAILILRTSNSPYQSKCKYKSDVCQENSKIRQANSKRHSYFEIKIYKGKTYFDFYALIAGVAQITVINEKKLRILAPILFIKRVSSFEIRLTIPLSNQCYRTLILLLNFIVLSKLTASKFLNILKK